MGKTTGTGRLRIGIVLSNYPVPSETFIHSFLGHLSEYSVYLFARVEAGAVVGENWQIRPYLNKWPSTAYLRQWLWSLFKIPFFYNRWLALRRAGLSAKQLIADANIWTTRCLDILHFPFATSAIGREQYARILRARMTISFRGSDINVYPLYHQYRYHGMWPYVHAVHCNAKELAVKLAVHDIPPTIPVNIIHPALRSDIRLAPARKPLKDTLGTASNPLVLLTLGRLHWVKDYPLAFRTLTLLHNAGLVFEYHVLGEGPEREHLMFLRHAMGLDSQVHLHGKASADTISERFTQAHIYLQTSLAEGFSNACLEAQAFGLPCVVPAISGMEECVEDGKTGLIVRERNEQAFAQALTSIAADPGRFDSAYIADRIRTNFSLKEQGIQWRAFFDHVMENTSIVQ